MLAVRSLHAMSPATVREQWMGSHHDLAMQHAGDDSVLGDFLQYNF